MLRQSLFVCLAAAVVVGSIACTHNPPADPSTTASATPQTTAPSITPSVGSVSGAPTTDQAVTLTAEQRGTGSDTVVAIVMRNGADKVIQTGYHFTLARQVGDQWETVDLQTFTGSADPYVFSDVGIELEPGESTTFEAGILAHGQPGETYRFTYLYSLDGGEHPVSVDLTLK